MPVIRVETTLPSYPAGFAEGLTTTVAQAMGLGEETVWLRLDANESLWHAGKKAEAILTLHLVGLLVGQDLDKQNAWCGPITDFIVKQTGLPSDKVILVFYPITKDRIARGGKLVSMTP